LQARIILKDKPYFYDASSPIKINLIHSLSPALFRSIQDLLKTIARVVVENNRAQKKGNQQEWFEQSNIANEVQRQEDALKKLLASNEVKQQIEGLNILYYFGKIGVEKQWARDEAAKYQNSGNAELKAISNDILQNVK
jgi:arabinogalactan endo-1,4-beta-galactosidase